MALGCKNIPCYLFLIDFGQFQKSAPVLEFSLVLFYNAHDLAEHGRFRPVLQQPDLQQKFVSLVVSVLRADAGPAHTDVQQLAGLFSHCQSAEHGGGGVKVCGQAEKGTVISHADDGQLLHLPYMLGAGCNYALHIDRFALIVAISSDPGMDGFNILDNLAF